MSFDVAQREMRERFAETLSLLNHIRQVSPEDFTPLDNVQKAMRGLWLVSLYGAVERSSNAIVESALLEVASHGVRSVDCVPALHSIIHFSKIQAVKDCGSHTLFDKSVNLLDAIFSGAPIEGFANPLAERMQNVSGDTLQWVSRLFGLVNFQIEPPDLGRLSMLKERRNAVAHGREAAAEVGERYTLPEMNNMYMAADRVCTGFLFALRDHCSQRLYLRAA